MEIVLLQDVEKVGKQNQILKVRDGFGRNYLIPKGLAAIASESNRKLAAERAKQEVRKEELMMSKLQQIVDTLKSSVVKVGAKVGTTEKIFGSVTTLQLADAIKKQLKINIDRKKISLTEEIKTLGTYKATIDLHKDVKVEVSFEVVGE